MTTQSLEPTHSSEKSSLLSTAGHGGEDLDAACDAELFKESLEMGEASADGASRRLHIQKTNYYARSALAVLTLCLAVRVFGYLEAFTKEEDEVLNEYNAYGSLMGISNQQRSMADAGYNSWETYLNRERSSSKIATTTTATGSLLGSTTELVSATANAVGEIVTAASEHDPLLYFNQTKAYAMLDPVTSDLYTYQNGWEAQITQALCAVATSAACLNSLRDEEHFKLPQDPTYEPFPWATQKDILAQADVDDCVYQALGGGVSNVDSIYHIGLGLTMIPRFLNCLVMKNGYAATGLAASDDDESEMMKEAVVSALQDPGSRVLLNYFRDGIGQGGGGHWSPLGAYNEESDRFLIMDVAKYKHPMVWVTWRDLWGGAHTVDSCSETLSLDRPNIDWSLLHAPDSDPAKKELMEYLMSRCVEGYRGFVVVSPLF